MRKTIYLLVALVMIMSLFMGALGCAKQAPAPTPAPTPAPAPTVTVTATPKPVTVTPTPTPTPTAPVSAADFYKGKVITINTDGAPGGSTDICCRVITSFLAEKTGSSVVVKNKSEGQGIPCINEFLTVVKPDGLTLLGVPTGTSWTNWLLDVKGVEYDISKLVLLGGIAKGGNALVVASNGPYTSVKALQQASKELNFAQGAAASGPTLAALACIEALGLNAKLVCGVGGSAPRVLSLLKGDAAATCLAIQSALSFEQQGQVKILALISAEKDKFVPDVPCLGDFVKLTDYHKTLLKGIFDDIHFLAAPPGTPKDRVEFLRNYIAEIFANKAFQAMQTQVSPPWLGAFSAEKLEGMALDLVKSKTEQLKLWDPLMKKLIK